MGVVSLTLMCACVCVSFAEVITSSTCTARQDVVGALDWTLIANSEGVDSSFAFLDAHENGGKRDVSHLYCEGFFDGLVLPDVIIIDSVDVQIYRYMVQGTGFAKYDDQPETSIVYDGNAVLFSDVKDFWTDGVPASVDSNTYTGAEVPGLSSALLTSTTFGVRFGAPGGRVAKGQDCYLDGVNITVVYHEPMCTPPAADPLYNASACVGLIVEGDCQLACAVGATGNASATCPGDDAEFVFSGCEGTCTAAVSAGYNVTGCGADGALLPEAACTPACARGYHGAAAASCPSPGGVFDLTGCTACSDNCTSCTDGATCLECQPSFALTAGVCEACLPNCLVCSNTSYCGECIADHSFNGTDCIANTCTASSSAGYDLSLCAGPLTAAECAVSCVAPYTGDGAASCPAAGGAFVLTGCVAPPACTFAAHDGYDGSGCAGSVFATACTVVCAAQWSGSAAASCSTDGGTFDVTGCERTCTASPASPGYDSTDCVGALTESACTVACGNGYMGTPVAACPVAGAEFVFSGCSRPSPVCNAHTCGAGYQSDASKNSMTCAADACSDAECCSAVPDDAGAILAPTEEKKSVSGGIIAVAILVPMVVIMICVAVGFLIIAGKNKSPKAKDNGGAAEAGASASVRFEMGRTTAGHKGSDDDHLTFEEGIMISIISKDRPGDGWWTGSLDGGQTRGIFPASCVNMLGGAEAPSTAVSEAEGSDRKRESSFARRFTRSDNKPGDDDDDADPWDDVELVHRNEVEIIPVGQAVAATEDTGAPNATPAPPPPAPLDERRVSRPGPPPPPRADVTSTGGAALLDGPPAERPLSRPGPPPPPRDDASARPVSRAGPPPPPRDD